MKKSALLAITVGSLVLAACTAKPAEPTEAEMKEAFEKLAANDLLGPKKVTFFQKQSCSEGAGMNKDNPPYVCQFQYGLNGGLPHPSLKTFYKNDKGWRVSAF